jgi:glycosyltransferase involved in cell wall biosynthesis
LDCDGDNFVVGLQTFGHHPNLFAFDPVALWRLLRSQDFDLIDIHEEPVSIAAAEVQILAWLGGQAGPFCLYSAQNIEKRYPIPFRWLERIALQRATAAHTCNEAAGRILRRKGFRGLICNLGLGIDVDRFVQTDRTSRQGPLRIGYVGRLETHKGAHVLIDAVARTREPCTLEMIGDGPEYVALKRRIKTSGAGDRIRLAGFVDHTYLPDRYRQFDVLAVPSLDTPTWIEQFGRVAVEAMACGVPVVGSDSGSLPEVVGEAGILVPPGDANAIATALDHLANNPSERRRLGRRARIQAERYSWERIATQQRQLYVEMLADGY